MDVDKKAVLKDKKVKVKCPTCGKLAKFVNSQVIYGKPYGMVWVCRDYPFCDSYVGAHKESGLPLGTLADANTRKARIDAHAAFDELWKRGKIVSRTQAYKELAKYMGMPVKKCHIGSFKMIQCKMVEDFVKDFYKKNK